MAAKPRYLAARLTSHPVLIVVAMARFVLGASSVSGIATAWLQHAGPEIGGGEIKSMASGHKIIVVPSIADLLNDPERISALPKDVIAELRGQIAKLDTLLLSQLLTSDQPQPGTDGDRLLTAPEAALRLGLTKDALYRNEYPFIVRVGSRRRFSEKGIEKFIRNRTGM